MSKANKEQDRQDSEKLKLTYNELLHTIQTLTMLVQPKRNNITFNTQNKAQILLSECIDKLNKTI